MHAFIRLSSAARIALLCTPLLALAQFSPGTAIHLSSDIHSQIGVDPEDLKLKTTDGAVFATIQDYAASMTILKDSVVEIHRPGGLLDNLEFSKGKAIVRETFTLEGSAIVREITWTDGKPAVTTCSVNGQPSGGLFKAGAVTIDLKDPKLALWLKPYSGKTVYALAGLAVLILGVLGWLFIRKFRRQHAPAPVAA